ncbi:MAG: hypothetical protein ACJ788_16925 [Ktedonobacteraceae bacterium]
MDEILWSLSWSAALTPELPMIPSRSVFLSAPTGFSLTATVKDAPGLLLTLSDAFFAHLLACPDQHNATCPPGEANMAQQSQKQADTADGNIALTSL